MQKRDLIRILKAMKDQRPLAQGFAVMLERNKFDKQAEGILSEIVTKAFHSANEITQDREQLTALGTTI